MRFVSDPAIATKIARMKERVRWQHSLIEQYGIDQTRLEILDKPATDEPDLDHSGLDDKTSDSASAQKSFSFLVIGDSGTSRHLRDRPQRHVNERLLAHSDECDFVVHTGDVVYLTGSSEQYPDNFIDPYREFLVGGENPKKIRFDKMIFKKPFLPVLGNHDYYDLTVTAGLLSKALTPLRRLLRKRINLDIGWHGSFQGEAFTRAFVDYLQAVGSAQLSSHLQKRYSHKTETGRCLGYIPGEFTRLPNRYYTFRRNGIDFFALDSNTFNAPQPIPKTAEGKAQREEIEAYQDELEAKMQSMLAESTSLDMDIPEEAERATSLYAKIEQVEEQLWDIEKQLNASSSDSLDTEQLDWLRDRLIASWQDKSAKGRVLYFHHPPYVTEKTKWFQAQTLSVRFHLRRVLNAVEAAVRPADAPADSRPLVDLVLSGHAHCFEYLKTEDTGHGDRHIPWIVCGGSGFSLRRQRQEGPVLEEYGRPVAKCHLFIGRSGHGSQKRRPYSALRVDVNYDPAGEIPQFVLRPLIAEQYQGEWRHYDLDPIVLEEGADHSGLTLPAPLSEPLADLAASS
ncbi:MAG: metallophosphoesterase [Phormidesmis sp.]